MSTRTELPPARYEFGGDEFIFVEIDEKMSIEANFKAMMITNELADRGLDGVVDICPSNASYMIRFDPDVIAPRDLKSLLTELDEHAGHVPEDFVLHTRVVDIPCCTTTRGPTRR